MAPRKYVMDRRAAASEATRLRVVEAAVALHGERGAAATRWSDIAERADVGLGTVYRYFPSYNELLPACTSHGLARLGPPTPQIFEGASSVGRRVTVLVHESFGFWERASSWIRHGECDRRTIPAAEAFYREQEAGFEVLVRAALGPLARRRQVVDTTVILSGFSSWAAFHDRGVATTAAATLVTEVMARWLGKTAMATKLASGDKNSAEGR
jgi:AcrR family transcriptional regulator